MSHEFEALSGKVLEAAIAVHRDLGPGFLESVYESAMKLAQGLLRVQSCPSPASAKTRKVILWRRLK